MKKDTEKLVKAAVSIQEDLDNLSVDKSAELKGAEPEIQEMSLEAKCKQDGVQYIKPKRRLSAPLGTLPEKLKKEHSKAWEYVKGIYENLAIPGEAITFSLCLYPGDPDILWEIPANVPVAVPRMVAQHLEEVQKYHQFSYRELPSHVQASDSFTHNFAATGVTYRGKFRPIGAFA